METGKRAKSRKADQELTESELQYQSLFETAQNGILIIDGDTGKIKDVNPFLLQMLGYPRDELLGKQLWEIGAFKDIKRSKEAYEELRKNNYVRYQDLPMETKDGQSFIVEFISNVYYVNHDRIIQCSIRDITSYNLIQEELNKQRAFLRQVIDSSNNLVFVKDSDDRYLLVNRPLAAAYGSTSEAMEGKTDVELGGQAEEYAQYRQDDIEVLQSGKKKIIPEERFTWPSGEVHYYQTTKIPLIGEKGIYDRILGISVDITGRKLLEQKLTEMATHDALTGLPNRTLLLDRCSIALANAQRNKKRVVIMSLDLDFFKNVNDTLGHDMGG